MWTLQLQRRRLKTSEPEDDGFVFRLWADFEFFIVALTRLRRAAVLASKVPAINAAVTTALSDFDLALPMVKNMRDIAEHFDDYAIGKGRLSGINPMSLETGVISDTVFRWMGRELNADVALDAGEKLFTAIQRCNTILFVLSS